MNAAMLSPRRCFALTAALLAGGAWLLAAQEPAKRPASSPEAVQSMKEGVEAMKRRDWTAAAAAWQKTVQLEPANAGAWANLGRVQLQTPDAAAAAVSLEKAVALQPALAEAWMALGLAYDRQDATMRALSCLTRAVHEAPEDARLRNALAIVLKKAGWRDAAESELQRALDLDPKHAEAHFNLAVMYLEHRPPALEMARRHYESARELGAAPDKDMEARLAGTDSAAKEAPPPETARPAPPAKPASRKPAKPSTTKPTRPPS